MTCLVGRVAWRTSVLFTSQHSSEFRSQDQKIGIDVNSESDDVITCLLYEDLGSAHLIFLAGALSLCVC